MLCGGAARVAPTYCVQQGGEGWEEGRPVSAPLTAVEGWEGGGKGRRFGRLQDGKTREGKEACVTQAGEHYREKRREREV